MRKYVICCRRAMLASTVALCLGVAGSFGSAAQAAGEINALVWCDHTDPEFIKPFEQANDVKVNLKEYEGTGAALSIIEQSQPGDWDVLVVDGVDVPRMVEAGILGPMPAEALPLDDLFPELVMADKHTKDGKLYAVSEAFGYNTIAFDKNKVDPADMNDMSVLWGDKYKGRIAVYDWYLPMIGLVGMGLGVDTADLDESSLPTIRDTLFKLKANTAQFTDVVASQTALATGEVDILFGGGEWLTAVLSAEMPNLDWVLPSQGGLRWSQSVGVFANAGNPEMALKFVQYIVSPEGQAKLATSSCYWAMPANQKAGALLNADQKAALRWDQQADYLSRSQLYPAPGGAFDEAMQDVWTEMQQQ